MNVYSQHVFEVVKSNVSYRFTVPAGVSYEDARQVLVLYNQQLDALEKEADKREKDAEKKDDGKKEEDTSE